MSLELSVFYRQVGAALEAGIPLTQGLGFAASGCRDARLQRATEDIERRVRAGGALGPALAAHPEVFPDLDAARRREISTAPSRPWRGSTATRRSERSGRS